MKWRLTANDVMKPLTRWIFMHSPWVSVKSMEELNSVNKKKVATSQHQARASEPKKVCKISNPFMKISKIWSNAT